MPVVPFIPAIISAGAVLGGTAIASKGNTKAADINAEAGDRALDVQREMYEQDRADMAPYRELGAYSLGGLGHLVGRPDTGTAAYTTPSTAAYGQAPDEMSWREHLDPFFGPASASPPRVTKAEARAAAMTPESAVPLALNAKQQTASSFVKMRAPTGEVGDVPVDRVREAEARGARRVG